MARDWAIDDYKARLDLAIEAGRWDEADRVRVATKRRLLEMVGRGSSESEIAAARDALADSLDRLRASRLVTIEKGPLAMATRILADAETAGIAAEQAPLPQAIAGDVKGRIIQILSAGNRGPRSTGELAKEVGCNVETASRAVSQLRAEGKITSRRMGKYVLHRLAEPQRDTLSTVLHANTNTPARSQPAAGAYLEQPKKKPSRVSYSTHKLKNKRPPKIAEYNLYYSFSEPDEPNQIVSDLG